MKLLMIYCDRFYYKTSIKNLESEENYTKEEEIKDALVAFIQAEEKDEENIKKIETKLIKNIKWAAGKNNIRRVVLHSFAHLSESKATPEITKELLKNADVRLKNANYETFQTPFGYFLDLQVEAPGKSLARIFKEF